MCAAKSISGLAFSILFAFILVFGSFAQVPVDASSSASETTTKLTLSGEAYAAAAKALAAGSSDLASLSKGKSPGYVAPKSYLGNIMSTNPDGSVGISTISQWSFTDLKEGRDLVTLQLTHGQNALNLNGLGHRGTLFVPGVAVDGKQMRFFIHLKVVAIDILEYSDKAFEAGQFNFYYSGKAGKKSQYTITCEVLAIEEVSGSVKLGIAMP